ncbi:hypothetical protein C8Q76DRAFT_690291 [Earliella scabrosa]|nr:hypothetical protein C8Q76DRAFT_690291 [Earliella scabrosa]
MPRPAVVVPAGRLLKPTVTPRPSGPDYDAQFLISESKMRALLLDAVQYIGYLGPVLSDEEAAITYPIMLPLELVSVQKLSIVAKPSHMPVPSDDDFAWMGWAAVGIMIVGMVGSWHAVSATEETLDTVSPTVQV